MAACLVEYLLPFCLPLVVIVIAIYRVRNPDRLKIEFLKVGSVEVSRTKPHDATLPPGPSAQAPIPSTDRRALPAGDAAEAQDGAQPAAGQAAIS